MLTIKNGYVIYTRGKDNPTGTYWHNVYQQSVQEISSMTIPSVNKNSEQYKIAGENLISLASDEREKEKKLLELLEVPTDSLKDVATFVKTFNQILMGKKQFEALQKRLKSALSKINQGKSTRAPSISSFYMSYLKTALARNINNFIGQGNNREDFLNKNFSAWTEQIRDTIIDQSIIDGFHDMLTNKKIKDATKKMYGKDEWQDVSNQFKNLQMNKEFIAFMRKKIGEGNLNKIDQIFQDGQNDSIKFQNEVRTGVSSFLSNQGVVSTNEKVQRGIGGSVSEYITTVINTLGKKPIDGKVFAKVFQGEIGKIDGATLYQFKGNINSSAVDNFFQKIDDNLNNSENLIETARSFEALSSDLVELNDSMIVYTNNKMYGLGESFEKNSGFSNDRERSIEDLIDIGALTGNNKVEDLVYIAYNTGEGAYFDGSRTVVSETIKVQLMEYIAYLLFDDFITIGKLKTGQANAIHVLSLDGLQVPLSVFLEALGKAMIAATQDMERFARIRVHLPESTLWGSEKISVEGLTGQAARDYMIEKWNEQAEEAKKNAYFSMTFYSNFKTEVKRFLK